ncbi:MAG: hypothetical protein AMXMBFR64_31690 [Myxococcales bacterium]
MRIGRIVLLCAFVVGALAPAARAEVPGEDAPQVELTEPSDGALDEALRQSQGLDTQIEESRRAAERDVKRGLYDIARVRYRELTEVVRDDMSRLDHPGGAADTEVREQWQRRARQLEEAASILRLLNVR